MRHFPFPHRLGWSSALRPSWLYYFCNTHTQKYCYISVSMIFLHFSSMAVMQTGLPIWIIYGIAAGFLCFCDTCLCYLSLVCIEIQMFHRQVFAWGSAPQSSGHSVALPADSGTWFQAGNLCPQSSLWSQTHPVPSGTSSCQKRVHCRSSGNIITSNIYLAFSQVTNTARMELVKLLLSLKGENQGIMQPEP